VLYEVAIPWSELSPLALRLCKSFGFTFTLIDNDDGSREVTSYLEWTPGIYRAKTPATFGQAVIDYAPSAGKSDLFVTSHISGGPNVSELNFRLARTSAAGEKIPMHITLSAEGKPTINVDSAVELNKGDNFRQITVQLVGIPDGLYEGVASFGTPGGEPVVSKFQYFRFATEPVRQQIDAAKADIAKLAAAKNPLYLRYAPSLTLRMQVADKWILNVQKVKEVERMTLLLDETRQIIDDLQAGKDYFAARRGLFATAYTAPEDNSVQPYRLTVPADYDGTKAYPLIVWLHGHGGEGMTFDYWYGLSLVKGAVARPGYITVAPYGRGNSSYQLLGRNDVFHVIDEVSKAYKIDPSRIYVMGFSMGGAGTWSMAVRYPDRWAGCSPQAGYIGAGSEWDDQAKLAAPLADWREQLSRANIGIGVIENLMNVPTTIFHGAADLSVPFDDSAAAFNRLRKLNYNAVAVLSSLEPHDVPKYEDNFTDWLLQFSRPAAPEKVRYRTFDMRYNKAYWIEIDEQSKDYQLSDVQAGYAFGKVTVTALNVNRLTLTVAKEMLGDKKDLPIVINGVEIIAKDAAPGAKLHLLTTDDGKTWTISPDQYRAGMVKKHGQSGPISEAIGEKFIIIYGTGGTEEMTAANRQAAEAFAGGIAGPGGTQMYGNYVAVADSDVSDAQAGAANLILYGGPESNKFARAMADKLPVAIKDGKIMLHGKEYSDPAGLAVRFIYPNPSGNGRYVLVNCGTTPQAVKALGGGLGNQPDWIIKQTTAEPNTANTEGDRRSRR
ncbi:MAG: hypothetical protein EHM48_05980, partial [Planctomycetaceae bacterium]